MRTVALILLLVLLAPALGHGHDGAGALPPVHVAMPSRNARLQALVEAAVGAGLPGIALRVKGPGIDFQGAAGVADLMTGEPLTTNHVMYVASLGKTFTAAVVLQLCEEGRLDLETPISAWLPVEVTRRIPSSEKITLRHVLSHTSGLIDYLNDDTVWRADFDRAPRRQWSNSEVVPYLFDKPLLFEPGTGFHYSNSNYILAGWILERVTGQPLHALIRKHILSPLGLKHTFSGDETIGSEARVHGYVMRRGRIVDSYPWYSHFGLADSGIYSTVGDLARFFQSLLATDHILSEDMRAEMTGVPESVHPPSAYGKGVFVQRNPRGAGLWYANSGVDPGYHADMMYLPDQDLTVVLFANASQGMADYIYERLVTAVVQDAMQAVRGKRSQR